MMAASLLIGVFVGVMDLVPSEVTQFVAGVDSRSETTQALAFLQADGLLDFLDEGLSMSDQSAAPERARRTPRWLLAILVASLLLNGLIVGAVAARRWAFGPHMPWPGSSVNAHLVGFAVTLPGERRREIWRSTETLRAEMRPIRKVMQEARDDVRAVLVADPFDPQRFEAAQKRLFDAEQTTRLATLKLIQSIAVAVDAAGARRLCRVGAQ